MTTEQGKVGGAGLIIVGALMVFGGLRPLDSSMVGAIVLALIGLALVWIGNLLRDAAGEVDYERDVLD